MNCVSGMTTVRGQNLEYPERIFPDSPMYSTYFDLYSYPSHISEIQPRKVEFISTPHISQFLHPFGPHLCSISGRPPSQLWRYIILLPRKRKSVLFQRESRVQSVRIHSLKEQEFPEFKLHHFLDFPPNFRLRTWNQSQKFSDTLFCCRRKEKVFCSDGRGECRV